MIHTHMYRAIAILAVIIHSVKLVPQLYTTYTTKRVNDLSVYSLILLLMSSVLWLLHGIIIADNTLIVAGVVSTMVNLTLIVLYAKYYKPKK